MLDKLIVGTKISIDSNDISNVMAPHHCCVYQAILADRFTIGYSIGIGLRNFSSRAAGVNPGAVFEYEFLYHNPFKEVSNFFYRNSGN